MTSRPYQHYSEAELLSYIADASRSYADAQRELDAQIARVRGYSGGARDIEERMRSISDTRSAMEAELRIRRAERASGG